MRALISFPFDYLLKMKDMKLEKTSKERMTDCGKNVRVIFVVFYDTFFLLRMSYKMQKNVFNYSESPTVKNIYTFSNQS